MQRILSILVTITWGLWFGGIIMLLLAVSSLFQTFAPAGDAAPGVTMRANSEVPALSTGRATAGTGAAGIFHRFEKYQLILAASALLTTFAWRFAGRAGMKTALFFTFGLATVAAVISTTQITPRIEAMRQQNTTTSPQFRKLHGISMMIYSAEAAILLIAGVILPGATRGDVRKTTAADDDLDNAIPSSLPSSRTTPRSI
jgi:hypothetical protein